MWLPRIPLTHDESISEFDQWVTPKLGDIRETERFRAELATLQGVVEGIASVVMEDDATHMEAIQAELINQLREPDYTQASTGLLALMGTLFLVTAKSDNAVKCQYPLHHRRVHGSTYPSVSRGRVIAGRAPDVLKSVDIVKVALRVRDIDWDAAFGLLDDYVDFLLADETDRRQFRALIDAYTEVDIRANTSGVDLLAPLVAFQVRGSVAASGGHDPEMIVRRYLESWGLTPLVHFNLSDITVSTLNNWLVAAGDLGEDRKIIDRSSDKTRAFDFILPYQVSGASRRVMIQSQFYAGDSGSVSHKNVDQAAQARARATLLFRDARFVELVDGAGYCASLRRDLRHLLFAADTDDFVQLRSIPIRLRRILQESGLIAPIEIALLVAEGADSLAPLEAFLEGKIGSKAGEWISFAVESGWILAGEDGRLCVAPDRLPMVRRYALIDQIVAASAPISESSIAGDYILVPGFGPDFGAKVKLSWEQDVIDSLIDEGLVMRWSIVD